MSPSSTIRNTDRSTPAGSAVGAPSITSSTSSPELRKAVDEPRHVAGRGLRVELGLGLLAQQAEQASGLPERSAAGALDLVERPLHGGPVGVQDLARGTRLHAP